MSVVATSLSSPAALRQQIKKKTLWLVRRGACGTLDGCKRCVEARRLDAAVQSCPFDMIGDLVDRSFFIQNSLIQDPGHSALTVLTTWWCVHGSVANSRTLMISLTLEFWHLFDLLNESKMVAIYIISSTQCC